MTTELVAISLTLVGALTPDTDAFYHQWILGFGWVGLFMAYGLGKKFGWIVAASWGWAMLRALMCIGNPLIGQNATECAVALMGMALLAYVDTTKLWIALQGAAIFSSLLIFVRGYGVIGNNSLDATLLACMYPAILCKPDSSKLAGHWAYFPVGCLIVVVVPAAILVSQSAIGILLLAGGLAYLLLSGMGYIRGLLAAAVTMAFVSGVGYWYIGSELWNDSGRYVSWGKTATLIHRMTDLTRYIGAGPGSFSKIMPAYQQAMGETNGIFLHAHNDWLQNIFELGHIGSCLITASWMQGILYAWRARKQWLVATWLAVGLACFFNFQSRVFFGALFMVLVAVWTFDENEIQHC